MNTENFWRNVAISAPDECWEWQRAKNDKGYGRVWFGGKLQPAHRIAYLLSKGMLVSGLEVCHTCDNPPCCNPKHLWEGTRRENVQDASSKGRLPGRQGHVGELAANAKLTDVQAKMIRTLYNAGKFSQSELGALIGVHQTTISKIVRGQSYRR